VIFLQLAVSLIVFPIWSSVWLTFIFMAWSYQ